MEASENSMKEREDVQEKKPIVLTTKDKIGCAGALLLFLSLVGLMIYGWWYFVKMGR